MRRLVIILYLFISFNYAFAQVISAPELPTENDSIKIIFDATKASRDNLVGYVDDLYVHTGVNSNVGTWQHVIESWGDNNTQPKLTRIGTDLYELVIGYPREFYNITNNNEQILSLNFVFRSANGNLQSEDIFLEIYKDGLNVSITEPVTKSTIVKTNEQLNIVAFSSGADSLFLFLEDILLAKTTEDSINYTLDITEVEKKIIVAIAKDSLSNVVSDTVTYVSYDQVVEEDLPNGIIQGINYTTNSSVTLALMAPKKDFVYVIGGFNNWEIDPNYFMKRTTNDSTYWLEINGLSEGIEYAFQYNVDNKIIIADPYTKKILDPWNDKYIDEDTYPNLKPYPTGKTVEAVSIIKTAEEEYDWKIKDFNRPDVTDLVIYELLIRDFLENHNYKTLLDTLDYLQNLGINAIELMPVNEFEGNSSWGYNPSFHFALDKYYGTPNDFKAFIDECHQRNIAVIMDAVLNHAFGQSPFVRLYNDGGYGAPTLDNPWLNREAKHPFNVGYDFNHESPHTKKFVDRFNKFWIEEFNIDGFRYDLSKGFTQKNSGDNVGAWGNYDQSRIDILTRMADQINKYDSTAYLILEHFAENREETVLANYGFMLWGNMNHNYSEGSMGYNEDGKSDLNWGSYQTRGWDAPNLVTYMESHDEERLMFKNLMYGNSENSYNIKELHTALNRMKLASVFFYSIPGPKMIWQFGELGYDYSINWSSGTSDDRLTPKPIEWNYFQEPERFALYRVNQELIKLKKTYNAFKTDNYSMVVSGSVKRIILYDDSMDVVIVGNFDVVDKSIIPNFPTIGIWYDFFSGDSIDVTNTQSFIPLEPGEYHIYTSINIPSPEDDITLPVKLVNELKPEIFSLSQNYPNPFNPTTTIKYSIPQSMNGEMVNVKLIVYDILGRKVATLVHQKQNEGNYKVKFNSSSYGRSLSSGTYFYRLSAGDFSETKKLMLLK